MQYVSAVSLSNNVFNRNGVRHATDTHTQTQTNRHTPLEQSEWLVQL